MNRVEPVVSEYWRTVGTVVWGLAIGSVFVVLQAFLHFGIALRGSSKFNEGDLERLLQSALADGTAFSIATIVSALICVPLVLGVIKLKRRSAIREYLALNRVPSKTVLAWLLLLAFFLVLSDLLTVSLGRPLVPQVMTDAYVSTRPTWLIWVALVLAAPLFEETFFRGFVFKGLSSGPIRPLGALVVTAILWAIMHVQYDVYGIATVFLQGLLLGAARMTTQSLFVPIAMHAEANIVASVETAVLLA